MTSTADLTLTFMQQQPVNAARTLEELNSADVAALLATVPSRIAAPAVSNMASWKAALVVEEMPMDAAAGLFANLPYDDALIIARAVRDSKRQALLAALPSKMAEQITASMTYPEGTVGALMDPSAPIFARDASVESALQFLRQRQQEEVFHIFLHDDAKQFSGCVSVAALLRASPHSPLSALAANDAAPLSNRATLASVSSAPEWDAMPMRPVVGHRSALVGGLSRAILRHAIARTVDERAGEGPAFIASHIFGMYIHTCKGLFDILSLSGTSTATHPPNGYAHDR